MSCADLGLVMYGGVHLLVGRTFPLKVKVRRCGNTVENVTRSRSGFTRSAAVPFINIAVHLGVRKVLLVSSPALFISKEFNIKTH